MLGKLLKYELKVSARYFFPIYLAVILMSIFTGLSNYTNILIVRGISTIILVGLFISLLVLTIIVMVLRFKKNLLDEEGYLTFTLPVTSKIIIISKCISSYIYALATFGLTLIAFSTMIKIIGVDKFLSVTLFEFYSNIFNLMRDNLFDFNLLLLLITLNYIYFILLVYFVLSLGQLPIFNKNRNITAFVSYFVINRLISIIKEAVGIFIPVLKSERIFDVFAYNHFYENPAIWACVIWVTVLVILFFYGTSYILENKLNLE